MVEPVRIRSWLAGANNIAPRDRLPEASLRAGVNVDPLPGGRLAARARYQRQYAGTAVRAVLALHSKLLIADGTNLVEFDIATNSHRVLRSIVGAGPMVGDVLNDRLYFCTADEALEYDGAHVRPWGVPDVLLQPAVVIEQGGTLQAGPYQLAMTYTDQWGREGGTDLALVISVPAGSSLKVTVPALPSGCKANVYVSAPGGSTLYLQRQVSLAGVVDIGSVADDTARCESQLCRAPRPGHIVCAHNGTVAVAIDSHVQLTRPLRPHLVDRARDFFQYPRRVGMLLSTQGRLFVSSDRVHAIGAAETSEVMQSRALEFPAVPGTGVLLPDGRAAWLTRYGVAIAGADGVSLINAGKFVPGDAVRGAAGALDFNGNQLIVSTLIGRTGASLASTDRFLGEVRP
ncbi:hypothetical protein [Pseudomonas sp. C11]|uniref:hypothetical protein n=1 Tax=Pseudomonas sp. C11 TaxID=3075550 RepID=UPI002AFF5286|nr:hypothetical protein [Pseudomonas sp. C11]